MENETEDFSENAATPIQYSVGEICKCYFTEIYKNVSEKVSQRIDKCQSFCRIVEKNENDVKEYTVELFDGNLTKKKLPGRCLRKVKLIPYTYEQSLDIIGRTVEHNVTEDVCDRITMVVSVVEDEGECENTINSIPSNDMMKDFHFKDTGAPVCDIVMMKADEAFES